MNTRADVDNGGGGDKAVVVENILGR